MPQKFKLGRLPRTHNPAVPHLSALRSHPQFQAPQLPDEIHNMANLPQNLGFMNNDRWGCCALAAPGHAIQVWTADAQGAMVTTPDDCVLRAYSEVTGCDIAAGPGNPTDAGANLQDVLTWWVKTGMPQADGSRRKIVGFVEIDPRNPQDICEAILECGLVDIGFLVPRQLQEDGNGELWSGTVDLGPIEGGHSIILPGYARPDDPVFDAESWGLDFRMDHAFERRYVDEIYGVISQDWIEQTGRSPWGLDLATIENQMAALRATS